MPHRYHRYRNNDLVRARRLLAGGGSVEPVNASTFDPTHSKTQTGPYGTPAMKPPKMYRPSGSASYTAVRRSDGFPVD